MAEEAAPSPDPNVRKKVDESWKESVDREKRGPQETAAPRPEAPRPPAPESNFSLFVSNVGMQALFALGEAADPATGEVRADPAQAKYLIDTLGMLEEKTRGNRTPDETSTLEGLLYELRTRFVEKNQQLPPHPRP